MIRRVTVLVLCGLGCCTPVAFGFSSNGSSLTRSLDKWLTTTNQPIQVTMNFINGGSNDLHGFFYTEQVPAALVVTPIGVVLNGEAVTNYTFERGRAGDVHAGRTPYRWILESPTNFAEAHPIPPQGSLQITYVISSSTPGSYAFQEFSWVGYAANATNACFGFSEVHDQQTATFVKGILTVSANDQSRAHGLHNQPLTATYIGFVDGDDTNVLNGSPDLTTTATIASPPGTYPINVSQGTLFSTSYSFNFVHGALTVVSSNVLIASIRVTNGVVTISWNAVSGQTYRVQFKNDLADENWSDLPPDVMAAGPTASKTDVVGSLPQRFYRVTLAQMLPAPPPVLHSIAMANEVVLISWSSVAGQTYRVQYKSEPAGSDWTDLPPDVMATGPTATKTDVVGDSPQRFYRVSFTPSPSLPPVIQSLRLNDGVITLVWTSLVGQTYRVQHKNHLSEPQWTELPIDVLATGPIAGTTDMLGSSPSRFYRVRRVPAD